MIIFMGRIKTSAVASGGFDTRILENESGLLFEAQLTFAFLVSAPNKSMYDR
jgi:hypothetical protein